MSTFSKLQRNISYKNYIIDLLFSFLLALLSSEYILVPLFIGLFITLNTRLSFILPFLFFTETLHGFPFFSLIGFYFIYKYYFYQLLAIKLEQPYTNLLSIIFVYLFYFLILLSYYTMQGINFSFHIEYLIYYILIEEILLIFDKRVV